MSQFEICVISTISGSTWGGWKGDRYVQRKRRDLMPRPLHEGQEILKQGAIPFRVHFAPFLYVVGAARDDAKCQFSNISSTLNRIWRAREVHCGSRLRTLYSLGLGARENGPFPSAGAATVGATALVNAGALVGGHVRDVVIHTAKHRCFGGRLQMRSAIF